MREDYDRYEEGNDDTYRSEEAVINVMIVEGEMLTDDTPMGQPLKTWRNPERIEAREKLLKIQKSINKIERKYRRSGTKQKRRFQPGRASEKMVKPTIVLVVELTPVRVMAGERRNNQSETCS